MTKWFILFLFINLSFLGKTQISVQQGDFARHKNALTHQGFLFADSLYSYSIDYQSENFLSGPKLLANQFDKKTQGFLKTIDLSPEKNEDIELQILQIFSLENNFITVSTQKPKGGDKKLVIEKRDAQGNRLKTISLNFQLYDNNLNENIEIVTDKVEKHLIICNNIPPTAESDQQIILCKLDGELNTIWTDTVSFPDREKQFLFSDWKFDGNNRIYFIGRHIANLFQPDLAFSSLTENSQYLFAYFHETKKVREVELSLNQRFINKLETELDSNRWIIAGTYSTDKSFKLDGVFSLILNLDLEKQAHSIHDFSESELKLFNTLSPVDKKKKFSDELLLKSIQIMDNGEFALVGEEFRKEWQEPLESRMSSNNFTEIFYYQNIFIFWFNKKGQVTKTASIPKNQISNNDEGRYSSFYLTNTGTKLLLFYNDNPKNREAMDVTAQIKSYSPHKKSYLNCAEMNSNGSVMETIIIPPTKRLNFQPSKGGLLLDGKTYFLQQKRARMSLIMITYKQ
jgi:hypothetical protein